MNELKEQLLVGERALFFAENMHITDCVFADGESPLKHSKNINLSGCIFKWKYPLWYSSDISVKGTTLLESARSGIWYTKSIDMSECNIDAPKTFRRSEGIRLNNVNFANAQETLWSCKDISMSDVFVRGDYFGMNCESVKAQNLHISGNYAFDGAKNVEIRDSQLISKDVFWNCENVTVYNSLIIGEYLGWNSKNVTLIGCTVESNQGMCYMDNLKMIDCKLVNTDLAFEYSSVEADIKSSVISIKNPLRGKICADSYLDIIMEKERVDVSKTEILSRQPLCKGEDNV